MQLNHFLRRMYLLKPDARGCWVWPVRERSSGFQYATVQLRGARRYVHRVAWEMANGKPVPAGMDVCHTCDNPPCCNPEHLWLGTRADNIKDCAAKGRQKSPMAEAMIAKTHCIKGHPFTPENTRMGRAASGNPARVCRECQRQWCRERRRRRTGT